MIKIRALIAGMLLLAACISAYAQFNGCPAGFCNTAGNSSPPPVGCNMNGVFDLTNTCNDIYLLTGVIK